MQNSEAALLLVRSANFGVNSESAKDNYFQKESRESQSHLQEKALQEFDQFTQKLKNHNIKTHIINDSPTPKKPDAIFPNNWFITLTDEIYIFPMKCKVRRLEKQNSVISYLKSNFKIKSINDLSFNEDKNKFLEGTGALIFDHKYKLAYCAISDRANLSLAQSFCDQIDYKLISFKSSDHNNRPIYHTNVLMSVLKNAVVICEEVIKDQNELSELYKEFESTNKLVIAISYKQMQNFCANILQVGDKVIMSQRAYESFSKDQLNLIEGSAQIIHSPLYTIEDIGGGGARCMLAEIYLSHL